MKSAIPRNPRLIFKMMLSVPFAAVILIPAPASAGLMDKLNSAAQKLNEKTKQMQSGKPQTAEDPNRPLHLEDHYKGSCEGRRSATCMDYNELVDQCMDPLKGYRMKLAGGLIEKKLKTETLADKRRKNLEEDLAGIREAEKNKSDEPTIAGRQKSQRYLSDISEEDQVCLNADYNAFYKNIYNKCIGADHMGIGKRTEMMKGETLTCEQAVAQYRAGKKKDWEPMECMKGVTGLRYQVMAAMMEKKMRTLTLSDKEKAEWEEDIAAVRKTAEEGGATMPQANDPVNPMRPLMRLTSADEQTELNNTFMKQSQDLMAKCQNAASASSSSGARSRDTGLVDHSKSPANKKAQRQERKEIIVKPSALGTTNLMGMKGYGDCYDPIIGHLAKVTGDTLETKLKAASGLTAQKRKEWEEDIAAWRAAEAAGADSPEPPDPDNPYRWYDYLTNAERQQINKQHADFSNKITRECGNRPVKL